ncbi:protein phosphatase 1 regulatory subunit 3B-like [Watersipora subatra]|uniref:protein phosphatase 1 regulatory subunit 3B-like n=1 Tax=Watersipora subatra TaxID=2589382 RepID=UPI00355B7BE0
MCGEAKERRASSGEPQSASNFDMQGGDRPAAGNNLGNNLGVYKPRYARVQNNQPSSPVLSRTNSLPATDRFESTLEPRSPAMQNSAFHYDGLTERQLDLNLQSLLWNLMENSNNNNNKHGLGGKVYNSCKEVEDDHISQKRKVQRRVSFADSVGLDLASIRIVTDGRDTPPYLGTIYDTAVTTKTIEPLVPLFAQPIARFSNFLNDLMNNNVSLESVDVKEESVTGLVKVKNLSYEKSVVVRYTEDEWRSYRETTCSYVSPVYSQLKANVHDTFSFRIQLNSSCSLFEFCICFRCQGCEFWDNNRGKNYQLRRQEH